MPLPARTDPEVQVSAVNVPAQVQQGEPFNVEVVIDSQPRRRGRRSRSTAATSRSSPSSRQAEEGGEPVPLPQTIEQERLAAVHRAGRGVHSDTLLDNNSDFGLVFTSGKPRVLLVESDPKQAKHLDLGPRGAGHPGRRPPAAGACPTRWPTCRTTNCSILSNVPATALTPRQMEVARTYVQDLGGGLIMLGGDQSFGLGGYYKTTLEEILPVRSDFEKEKEKPSLAMMLVIDKSGSMGGEKIEMAKEAAKSRGRAARAQATRSA